MSQQETYYLFVIEYDVDDYSFNERYVIEAETEFEAKMRLAHGLETWYDENGLVPDSDGIHYNAEVRYSGYVEKEVSWQFADECPQQMKMFGFGSDYQPNLKDMAVNAITENELTYAEHVEAKEAQS